MTPEGFGTTRFNLPQEPGGVAALFDYPETNCVGAPCEGTPRHNGFYGDFYGDGIVNALAASIGSSTVDPGRRSNPRGRPSDGAR